MPDTLKPIAERRDGVETFRSALPNDIERGRFATLLTSLAAWRELIAGARVLDFGASYGLSAVALIEHGARSVTGVEPDPGRVALGHHMLAVSGFADRIRLTHVSDTRTTGLASEDYDFVLCNAVLEHIPQPRRAHVAEMWRLLRPGGTLLINETPNKYLPWDYHTTGGLWLVPWLPSRLARRYAVLRHRFDPNESWEHSGWRGLGYFELTAAIPGHFVVTHEMSRRRHRLLRRLGLPSGLLDPYPIYQIRKLD